MNRTLKRWGARYTAGKARHQNPCSSGVPSEPMGRAKKESGRESALDAALVVKHTQLRFCPVVVIVDAAAVLGGG